MLGRKEKNGNNSIQSGLSELINEQVKLFYSNLDEVTISYDDHSFKTIEFVQLGLGKKQKYYPLEEVVINFEDNGKYQIQSELVFSPPEYDKKTLHHIFNANNSLLFKIEKNIALNPSEKEDLNHLSDTYLISYLNGFEEAKTKLEKGRKLVKEDFPEVYDSFKEALRIIRKVKYN